MARRHVTRRVYAMTPGWWLLRALFIFYGVAALIGLVIGVIWTIAGLLHFHPLW